MSLLSCFCSTRRISITRPVRGQWWELSEQINESRPPSCDHAPSPRAKAKSCFEDSPPVTTPPHRGPRPGPVLLASLSLNFGRSLNQRQLGGGQVPFLLLFLKCSHLSTLLRSFGRDWLVGGCHQALGAKGLGTGLYSASVGMSVWGLNLSLT